MASPYTQGSRSGGGSAYLHSGTSRSGSVYVTRGGGSRKAPKRKPHGALGLVENLSHDVAGAVVGLPAGLVQTVEHPLRTVKNVGRQYATTYGPLVHGDVSGFLHQLYSHPLGPLLDLATIVTLGSGAAAKAGVLSSEAARLELRGAGAAAGQGGRTVARLSSRNPAIRARQLMIHKALNRLPYEFPHVGEAVRYAREAQRLPRRVQRQLIVSPEMKAYNRAVKSLTGEEMAALHLIGNDLHPLDYATVLRRLRDVGRPSEVSGELRLGDVADRKIGESTKIPFAGQSDAALEKKLAEFNKKYDALVLKVAEAEHGAPGFYKSETAYRNRQAKKRARRGLPPLRTVRQDMLDSGEAKLLRMMENRRDDPVVQRIVREADLADAIQKELTFRAESRAGFFGHEPRVLEQAKYEPVAVSGPSVKQRIDPAMLKVLEHPKVVAAFERPTPKMLRAVKAAEDLTRKDAALKVQHGILTAEAAAARVAKHQPELHQILGELGAKPRVTPGRPFYVPDVPYAKRLANPGGQKFGAGASVPKNIVKQNNSVLFHTGQLALTPDLLGPKFLETVKYGLADDLHATMVASAARISHEEAVAGLVPKGWEFVPKEVITKTGSKRAQRIHPLVKGAHQGLAEKEHILPSNERIANSFRAVDINNAATLHGDYLIVPTRLKRELVGEFHRSTSAIRQFIDKPTKVWRSLVLGLRVGFLTNNLIGNHLLYAIHAAGVDGLRAYLNAVKREKGAGTVRSLLDDHELPPALRERFMGEFFPEQETGSFGATQRPEPGKLLRGKKGRKVRAVGTGLLPATQAVAETNLRRALIETYIRRSPEFKRVYRAMPSQTRDFEAAARKILRGEGGHEYQRMISEKVNNVLGDYLSLGPTERNVLRAAFPFYSWYKAITRISLHLAFDTPGRAQILVKLGQIGQADTLSKLGQVPSYLQGLIPLGQPHGGSQTVLSTRGLNPFVTVSDIGGGVTGLLTGKPGDTGKAFSQLGPTPFLSGAIENLTGKQLFTGKDLPGHHLGLPGAIVANIGGQLPQAQLIQAAMGRGATSKLYGKKDLREALLQFLGAPVRQLNVPKARSYG